jgi:phosphohistidine phosphatase
LKRLYLLRHAKSDWGEPGLADRDRPLSARGRKGAPMVAAYMAENDLRPALVLVSPALRVRQTLEFFSDVVSGARVEVEPDIYEAGVDDLLAVLRRAPDEATSVLLVGHNPTMQDLVLSLASGGPGLDSARAKFPTAALAVLDAEVDAWSDLGPGSATMTHFVSPKTLG